MNWVFDAGRPIYSQLIEQISRRIINGVYAPGSRLPSVRELAAEARVNPNTMQRALSELERDGMVYSERTAGRFVTADESLIEGGRKMLAEQIIEEFFRRMEQLGLPRTQALAMAAAAKEDSHESI